MQSGAFDLPFLEYFGVAARLMQEDRKTTRFESAEMQVWRFMISQFTYGSAAIHKAVEKYLKGGHVTRTYFLSCRVLQSGKIRGTWCLTVLYESVPLKNSYIDTLTYDPQPIPVVTWSCLADGFKR